MTLLKRKSKQFYFKLKRKNTNYFFHKVRLQITYLNLQQTVLLKLNIKRIKIVLFRKDYRQIIVELIGVFNSLANTCN